MREGKARSEFNRCLPVTFCRASEPASGGSGRLGAVSGEAAIVYVVRIMVMTPTPALGLDARRDRAVEMRGLVLRIDFFLYLLRVDGTNAYMKCEHRNVYPSIQVHAFIMSRYADMKKADRYEGIYQQRYSYTNKNIGTLRRYVYVLRIYG